MSTNTKLQSPTWLPFNRHIATHKDNTSYVTNALVTDKEKPKYLKTVQFTDNGTINFAFIMGKKDEYLVIRDRIDYGDTNNYTRSTPGIIPTFTHLDHISNHLGAAQMLQDMLNMYPHVHEDGIDNHYLHSGIDQLANQYDTIAKQRLANVEYTFLYLTLHSEFQYLNAHNDYSEIGPALKMYGLICVLHDNEDPITVANRCGQDNVDIELLYENINDAKQRLINNGFNVDGFII